MARDWESDFMAWSKPPTATEDARCENAESVVSNAVHASFALATRNVEVFAQGSYRNGTNVRAESDVDICVRCTDVCFFDLPAGVTKGGVGLIDTSYTYSQFKSDVEAALVAYLGRDAVSRGNKAFDLHANSYRVDADVVATFEHRRYHAKPGGGFNYLSGTEFVPDRGGRVINWPQQNYRNGTDKNQRTGERYKKMVRVLKRLRNEMDGSGVVAVKPIPSYLIECLVWNVPDTEFGHNDLADDIRAILVSLHTATRQDDGCSEWGEVNELKYLFRGGQPWTREQANAFVLAAWNHIGFR